MEPNKNIFGNAGFFSSGNNTTSGNLFGGAGSGAKPAISNLFGSQTNNTPQAVSSTTPQSSPAKPNIFGNALGSGTSTTVTSGFLGANNSNAASNPTAAANSPFLQGTQTANNQNNKDGASTAAPSIFGNTAPSTGNNSVSNIFGAKSSGPSAGNTSPSLFGSPLNASQPATPSATPSLFGAAPAKQPAAANEVPAKPASNPFGGTSNSLFAAKSTLPAKSSPLATSSAVPGDSSSQQQQQAPSSAPPNTSPSKTSTTSVPSLLRGKTLEDLVARWNSELDDRVSDFKHTANEIAAWDQVLIQNGDQISMLYEELQRIDPIQSSIDQTLDFVETQQNELSNALQEYERQLSDQPQDYSTPGRLKTAAQEREEAYRTAEEVHGQLDDMANSLGSMIAELNSLAQPHNRTEDSESVSDDPIIQIAGILNAHLSSLNWISDTAQELSTKVSELEGRVAATKVEFGLESRQIQSNLDETNGLNSRNLTNRFAFPR
ncbi:nucleoporin 62kDa [Phakopsora pachyrhizi]|uniref:Nucleoporin NSP1 n=1 Tax=Phakopsora pachyrhizi TaxID=170000 RepID=A0AAV0BQY3_PHAPC|nr:nucleoporin 62kDa [Phakopsora pachyrhizi]